MNLKFWQWKKDREEKELVRQVVQRMECNVSRYTIQLVSPNGTVLSQAPYTVGQTDFTFAQGCNEFSRCRQSRPWNRDQELSR